MKHTDWRRYQYSTFFVRMESGLQTFNRRRYFSRQSEYSVAVWVTRVGCATVHSAHCADVTNCGSSQSSVLCSAGSLALNSPDSFWHCQRNVYMGCSDGIIYTIQYNTIINLYIAAIQLSRSANKNYEKVSVNRNDFKCRLKALVSVIIWGWGGREFHAVGPE